MADRRHAGHRVRPGRDRDHRFGGRLPRGRLGVARDDRSQMVAAPRAPGLPSWENLTVALAVAQGSRRLVDALAVTAAVLASIAMINLVTDSLPVTLSYA